MKPIWKHDHDCCKFLGSVANHDMYRCGAHQADSPTYLLRWSNEPSEYYSASDFTGAIERACTVGASYTGHVEPEHFQRLTGLKLFAHQIACGMVAEQTKEPLPVEKLQIAKKALLDIRSYRILWYCPHCESQGRPGVRDYNYAMECLVCGRSGVAGDFEVKLLDPKEKLNA